MLLLSINIRWLRESGLESITLDEDSTSKPVCGHQEGAEKEFNTTKKGVKNHHPLMVFVSEMKLLYPTLFRSGSALLNLLCRINYLKGLAFTSNDIDEFLKEVQSSVLRQIRQVSLRADSWFFSGELFDLLESFYWDYLVKVKLKNPEDLLKAQTWVDIEGFTDVAICEFSYRAKSWQRSNAECNAISYGIC